MSTNGRRWRRARARGAAGMTLIEVMVVVVIMGLIMSAALVGIGAQLRRARAASSAARATLEQHALSADVVGPAAPDARPPRTESSDVLVALSTTPVLDGVSVRTRYRAEFRGEFAVRNADPRAEALRVFFPFPRGVTESRDTTLLVRGADGELREPEGVDYSLEGIRWVAPVAPGGAVHVVVRYTAFGQDAFRYDAVGDGRSGRIRLRVELREGARAQVPDDALQPTSASADHLAWSFDNLLTQRQVVVNLPPGPSPLGRLVLLCQLAALGVALFSAGLWYLSELHAPGRIDAFRWPQLVPLALNYSVFFVLFAVLAYDSDPRLALAVAAGVALPLLGVHVAQLFERRFALTQLLPLLAVTLAIPVLGAYVPAQHRALLAVLVFVAVSALVTLTQRRFAAGRAAYRAQRAQQAQESKHTQATAESARDEVASAVTGEAATAG